MILFGYAIDYRNLGSGEPVITRTNYSIAEKIYFLSLTYPYLGITVLISWPFSCKAKGILVENSARVVTFANGIISVVK